ncbi:CPBP family intramembrane glutamic endopeptidase [Taklimakanibacter deserti]|uniref:CPBP family intramembrane glutamic endopeptidase n=1 Tax=Taklimakanibacter deserti TaxID=2267839 RepID=UPI000E64A77A
MEFIGPDFRAGLRETLYRPFNPAGLAEAICIFLALFILNQLILQPAFAVGIAAAESGLANLNTEFLRGAMFSILPAGLITAYLAWLLARRHGADPREVLALRFPALGAAGWVVILGGFIASLLGVFAIIAWLFDFDLTSSGEVEKAVMRLSGDPLFYLIAAGLVIGGPLAEEMTFRGQIFAALTQSRLGVTGASLVTSGLWAGVHITEPFHVVALLFLMGLVLSWLLVRFGSLWVPIACHAAWNGLQAVALSGMTQQ